jgi:hypothetical protein
MDDREIRTTEVLVASDLIPRNRTACLRIDTVIDEGNGKFRFELRDKDSVRRCLGIYEQHDDHLRLCFGNTDEQCPRAFRGGDGQNLLILHRVKPRK